MVPVFVRFGSYHYRSHICVITGNKIIFSFSFFFASGVYEMTVRKYQTIVTHFYMIFPHVNRREDDYSGFHIYAILRSKVWYSPSSFSPCCSYSPGLTEA